MASNTDSNTQVTISAERFRELEKLETDLPKLLEKAKEEARTERFTLLRERDKTNPEAHRQRSIKWQKENREEYNAKQRERYQKKKAAKAVAENTGS